MIRRFAGTRQTTVTTIRIGSAFLALLGVSKLTR